MMKNYKFWLNLKLKKKKRGDSKRLRMNSTPEQQSKREPQSFTMATQFSVEIKGQSFLVVKSKELQLRVQLCVSHTFCFLTKQQVLSMKILNVKFRLLLKR